MTLDSARINWGKLASRILLYFVVSLICIVILYPYFVMFCTAPKSRDEIFSPNGTVFPINAMWSNFVDIGDRAPMGQYMLNSIIIAGGSTAIAMICGIPAAYALARMKFKGQTAFLFHHCLPDVRSRGASDRHLQSDADFQPDRLPAGPDLHQCSI